MEPPRRPPPPPPARPPAPPMAAASQSLGAAQGRWAAPGIRCTGFRSQIQQVLGWRKGVKPLGTPPGFGNPGPGQAAQCVPVQGGGPEPGTQPALGRVLGPGESPLVCAGASVVEQRVVDPPAAKASSELDLGKRLTQVSQSALGGSGPGTQASMAGSVGLEQVIQTTLGKGGGLQPITQSSLGKSVIQLTLSEGSGLEQIVQSTMGESGRLEQVARSTLLDTGGLDQVTQSALSKRGGLQQVTQATLGQSDRSEEVTQSTLGQSGGSDQGIQPVDGCSSESEEQVQFVISDCESEKGINCARGNGLVPEQPNSLMKGMNLTPDSRIGSAVGLKLEPEEGAPIEGINFQPVQPNLSAVHGATRSKEQAKLAPFHDARSAWGKKLEQCRHLSLAGTRTPKQQMLPLKCQDVELLDPAQKVGLEQQFFITLTQSLSHLSGLCESVQLADGSRSHLGPGKRDWPSRPTVRKRAKSCPGSPAKRRGSNRSNSSNRVRFADSFGLELTEVRSFDTSEDPTVPAHVLASFGTKEPTEHVIWVQRFRMEFTNPKDDENFSERLDSQKVCLEAVTESELVISGTILVINLAYHKEVTIRYTCTDWRLLTDVSALFESNIEGRMDRFMFTLNPSVHMLQPGCCLQFAIRYNVEGVEFWDNNNGSNYKMTYQSLQVTVPNDSEDRTVDLD